MTRKMILLGSALLVCVGGLVYGGYYWSQRVPHWRNKRKARRVCKRYRKAFKRECKVVRGRSCGTGWKAIKTYANPTYQACRHALRNENIKRAKNALSAISPFVTAYKLYMAHIAKGSKLMKLPRKIRKLYQPHYRVPLFKLRYGISRQLTISAITDCYNMYFQPGLQIRRQLRNGVFSDKETELFFLHELAHAEQCFKVGGRNNYAKMWFRHLRKSLLRNILKGTQLSSENIHKQQPMEKKADRKALRVQQKTNNYWK